MANWYFNDSGQQRGPIPEEELKSLLSSRKISPQSLVWSEGMAEWKSATEISELQPSPYAPPSSITDSVESWSGYTPSGPQIRPWVRYWARTSDSLLFCLIVGLIVPFVYPSFFELNDTLVGIVLLVFYNFVEPILLSTIGTTPFKALMGVRVRNGDGSKLSYPQALTRILTIWIRGQGLGIPIITLITHITSYSHLSNEGITPWDRQGNFIVSHQSVIWWRWLVLALFFVGFVGLMVLGSEA
jgi:hypothetical protein